MRGFHKYFKCGILMILAVAWACNAEKYAYSLDENLYKKDNHDLNARSIVYHKNDSVSQLHFIFSNENLLYKRPDTSTFFYARVRARYVVLNDARSKKILDSGSVWLYDRQQENVIGKELKGVLKMKIQKGSDYIVDLTIFDQNKKTKNNKFIEVEKTTTTSKQNFLMQTTKGNVYYNYYLNPGDTVYISNDRNSQSSFRVDLFTPEFQSAPPPYSVNQPQALEYKPVSSFIEKKINTQIRIIVPPNGFNHIVAGTDNEGLTIFSVDNTFPGIRDETEMIKSTHYIMQHEEYNNCLQATNKKKAIDEFWKDIGGSNERARELLKSYYNRVQQANKLFTSYQQGWQTDRGMIYIVFGAPTNMYKYAWGEEWIYGVASQPNSVTFNFKKMLNPFSDNTFILDRNEFFKNSWYYAVEYWRQGHIYSDN